MFDHRVIEKCVTVSGSMNPKRNIGCVGLYWTININIDVKVIGCERLTQYFCLRMRTNDRSLWRRWVPVKSRDTSWLTDGISSCKSGLSFVEVVQNWDIYHHHHHHQWLDSPTWALAFLRNFCQLKYLSIASSDFVTRVFSRVGLSAPRPTPGHPGGPIFSLRVLSLP
jgi:hypothetical protein